MLPVAGETWHFFGYQYSKILRQKATFVTNNVLPSVKQLSFLFTIILPKGDMHSDEDELYLQSNVFLVLYCAVLIFAIFET